MKYLYNVFTDLGLECYMSENKKTLKVYNDGIFVITRFSPHHYECLYLLPNQTDIKKAEIFTFSNYDSVIDFVTYI